MPTITPNFGLKKPLKTESYTITDVTNGNMDILDSVVNGKQPTLVSGTNIKTINSTSLLGGGNVAVQPTLVSGTNIKSINGSSILSSGDLELLPKENPISTGLFDLQGGQIKFPATQVPSSGPNTLDDYEEGTFTPVVVGSTSAGVGTYSIQTGKYTKIGDLVQIQIYLNWTAHTGTGALTIEGLPFVSEYYSSISTSYISNLALTANYIAGAFVESGLGKIQMVQQAVGGGSVQLVQMDSSAVIMLGGTYKSSV
jgi:hypothetical protein